MTKTSETGLINVYTTYETAYCSDMITTKVVAQVRPNTLLDDMPPKYKGSDFPHKGITRLIDGSYVIILTNQNNGVKDFGYTVSGDTALMEIWKSGREDLLKLKKFMWLGKDGLIPEDTEDSIGTPLSPWHEGC